MNSLSSLKKVQVEGGGFRLPGIPLTLYPTSDPNRVKIKMNDLAIKTCTTGRYIYSTQPSPYYMMSPETLALRNKAASSSKFILHGFGPKKRPSAQQHVATQPEETSAAAAAATPTNLINASEEAPPPTSTEGQAEEAGGPALKRARLDPNPSAADSKATGSRNN